MLNIKFQFNSKVRRAILLQAQDFNISNISIAFKVLQFQSSLELKHIKHDKLQTEIYPRILSLLIDDFYVSRRAFWGRHY